MPKWVYPLAFAFVLFYIYNDATAAGFAGRGFVDFLGTVLDALGEFVEAFSDAGETPNGVDPQAPSTVPTTVGPTDSFGPATTVPVVPETVTLTASTTTP